MTKAQEQVHQAQPLLSIVIPSYNAMPFIEEALTPIVEWPSGQVEILVQDGGSTDGTVEAVQAFGDRVKLVSAPDRGQSDALNKGIERSSGKYIGWLNADDLYLPPMWPAVESIIARSDSPDAIYGDYSLIFDNGDVMRRIELSDIDWKDFITRGFPVWSGATIWKREVFERFGYFDASLNYTMDAEFFLRVAGKVTVRHVPTEFGRFRIHGASKTSTSPWQFLREAHGLRLKYSGRGVLSPIRVLVGDAKQIVYSVTQDFRYSRAWARIRKTHRFS